MHFSQIAVISENKEFYKFHYPFQKKKLCYNLGYYKNLSLLKLKIEKLLNDYKSLSKNKNSSIIDTKGSDRIIKKIKEKFF